MKTNFMRFLLAACIVSLFTVPAYAANVDADETSAPESEAVTAPVESDGTIMPRGDEYLTVKYNNVHIRTNAGTKYPSYGLLQKGQTVLWESYNQGTRKYADGHYWIKVLVYDPDSPLFGIEGWVAEDYLQSW